MLKSISTFAAAMIAAGIVALPSLSPQVRTSAPVLCATGDRIDARPLGIACSQREWRILRLPTRSKKAARRGGSAPGRIDRSSAAADRPR